MSPPQSNTALMQELLDQASDGHQEARDELVLRASSRLHALARRMLKNYPHLRRWEQTDDVFQNAAIRLHRSLSEVQPDSLRGFFRLAATQIRRTLIDLARHHFGPQGHAALHQSDASHMLHHPDRRGEPESLAAWVQFHEVIERMPVEEREVFELTWYGDMHQDEIADLLGVSVRTVKRRWRAARTVIGEALDGKELM